MKKLLVAAIAVVVLALGAAVPALAINTQAWEERRIATEAFDAAAELAVDASASAASAQGRLTEARDGAAPVLADAQAVAASAVGYLTRTLATDLQTRVAALESTLSGEAPDGVAMPETERPESVADLLAAVPPLTEWAANEEDRAVAVGALAEELSLATTSALDAAVAAAESVTPEAAVALGAAPLATPESRSAVESARDAVIAAVESGEVLGSPVATYASAVAALRASQQAAVDAAAAAAAEEVESGFDSTPRIDLLRLLMERGGYDESDCVPIPNGYACGGLP